MKNKIKNYAPRLKTNSRDLRKTSTPQEIKLWSKIKNRKFHNLKFRRQHVIDKYIVDFICLENKIIIELDGSQHKRGKDIQYDRKRNEYLKVLGLSVLRFWNNEVNENLDGVMLKIEKTLGVDTQPSPGLRPPSLPPRERAAGTKKFPLLPKREKVPGRAVEGVTK